MASSANQGLFQRVLGAGFHYGLGSIIPKVISFVLVPVYAATMTPEAFGVVDVSGALSGVLVIAMRFAMPGSLARFYFEYGEAEGLRDYVTTITAFLLGNALLIGALSGVLSYFWIEDVFPGFGFYPYVVLTIATSVVTALPEIQMRLIQAREQSKLAARLNVTRGLLFAGLSVLLVVGFKQGALGMLLALALSSAAYAVQAVHYLWPLLWGRLDRQALRTSLTYASGIVPGHVVAALAPAALRSVISNEANLAVVGLLGVANRFLAPITMVADSLSSAYGPVYFAARTGAGAHEHQELALVGHRLVAAGILLGVGTAALGPPVVRLLLPPSYHDAASILPILAFGSTATILRVVFCQEIFFQKRTSSASALAVGKLAVTVALAWALVPRLGASGAAWALSVGLVLESIGQTALSALWSPLRHDWLGIVRASLVGAAFIAAPLVVMPESALSQLALGGALVVGAVLTLAALGDDGVRSGGAALWRRVAQRERARQ